MTTNFGPIPQLTWKQKLQLRVTGFIFYKYMKPEGYTSFHPIYIVRCPKHGLYLTKPAGYDSCFRCSKCIIEMCDEETKKFLRANKLN